MSSGGPGSVIYRESLFTPAQAGDCTGLSPAMQRNWRQAGHIAARTTDMALFAPRDLAAIRIMVVLRDVGLGPALSRSIAEQAAPSVIWLALADFPSTWTVAGDGRVADVYRRELELVGDSHLRSMAGLNGPAFAFGLAQGKTVHLVSAIDNESFDADDEVERVIKFRAVANRIAHRTTQPLFTVVPPSSS